MVRWVVGSILQVVNRFNYFSFQTVLHDWCNKGRGMCYPVCGMAWTEEPTKAGTCARDKRALQQLALNVHVKHSDLT